jgi:hypothetical protein
VRHLTEKEAENIRATTLDASAWIEVTRLQIALLDDDEDPDLRHLKSVKANRLPAETPGRTYRIEGVWLPGLKEPVTRMVSEGDSTKDADDLLSKRRPTSNTKMAKALILDLLEVAPRAGGGVRCPRRGGGATDRTRVQVDPEPPRQPEEGRASDTTRQGTGR